MAFYNYVQMLFIHVKTSAMKENVGYVLAHQRFTADVP